MAFVLQKFPVRINYTWKEMVLYTIIVEVILSVGFLVAVASLLWNPYAGIVGILTGLAYISFSGVCYYGVMIKPNRTFFGAVLGASCVLVFVALQSAIFWGQYANCTLSSVQRRRITMSTISNAFDSKRPSTVSNTPEHGSLLLQQQQGMNVPRFHGDRIRIGSSGLGMRAWATSQDQLRHLSTSSSSSSSFPPECSHRWSMRMACAFSVFMFITYLFFILVLFRFKDDILGSKPLDEGYLSVPTTEHTTSTNTASSQHPVVSSSGGFGLVSTSEDL